MSAPMPEIGTRCDQVSRLLNLPTSLLFLISTYLEQRSFFIWFRLCSRLHSASLQFFGLSVWDFSQIFELHEIKYKSTQFMHCKVVYLSSSCLFPRNAQWCVELVGFLQSAKSTPEVILRLVPVSGELCHYGAVAVFLPFLTAVQSCSAIPLSFPPRVLAKLRSLSLGLPGIFHSRHWRFQEKGLSSLRELVVFQNHRMRYNSRGALSRLLYFSPNITHLKLNLGFTKFCCRHILKHCKSLAYVEITLSHYIMDHISLIDAGAGIANAVYNGLHCMLSSLFEQLQEESCSRKLVIHIGSLVTRWISLLDWELWADLMRFAFRMKSNTNVCLQWAPSRRTVIDYCVRL